MEQTKKQRLSVLRSRRVPLLLLLGMHRVLTQAWTVLQQLELLATHLSPHCVVVVPSLTTDEKDRLDFFLSLATGFLCHDETAQNLLLFAKPNKR